MRPFFDACVNVFLVLFFSNFQVAAQASFSGFGASAGGGFSVGVGSKEEAFNRVQNTSKEQYEYYIGGNPPSGDFKDGGTESLREWARSADEKPVPIQYKLISIDTLLKPGYFKDITYGRYYWFKYNILGSNLPVYPVFLFKNFYPYLHMCFINVYM